MSYVSKTHIKDSALRHFYVSFIKFSLMFADIVLIFVLSIVNVNAYNDHQKELLRALDRSALAEAVNLGEATLTHASSMIVAILQNYEDLIGYSNQEVRKHPPYEEPNKEQSSKGAGEEGGEDAAALSSSSVFDSLNTVHTQSYIATTVCKIDNAGTYEVLQNALGIDDAELSILMNHIAMQETFSIHHEQRGRLISSKMYYVIKPVSGDIGVISVASSEYIEDALKRSLVSSVLIFVGGMALFFVLSLVLASFAARPLRIAWDAQQQFISDASHELKTPLAVIQANMSVMKSLKDATYAENLRWITSTQEVAQSMTTLIEDMLHLSKTGNRDEKRCAMYNLSEIVEKAILQFESRAFEQRITLVSDVQEGIGMRCDEAEMLRLVTIFIDNACKYAYTDTKVTISLKHISKNRAVLSIHNVGDPIPDEAKPHLFDRFYRVNKERERKSGSWGLGLAIAKNIVDMYKGKINVESTEADGTTFTIYVPATSMDA